MNSLIRWICSPKVLGCNSAQLVDNYEVQFLISVLIDHVGTPRCFTVVVDAALLMCAFYIYSPDNVKL